MLLKSKNFIGRQDALNYLTGWTSDLQHQAYTHRLLAFVAIGGMGKSALTWYWFNEQIKNSEQPFEGAIWWSFYEHNASFEQFLLYSLVYFYQKTLDEVRQWDREMQEQRFYEALDTKNFLVVLDGFERELLAYSRLNAAYLDDGELDEQTANMVVQQRDLPPEAITSFIRHRHLRRTTDPKLGIFLRRLTQLSSSRLLISTRLYPTDLQTTTGHMLQGSVPYFLSGLSQSDVLNLWHTTGVVASDETLLHLSERLQYYPLLIRILAGTIANHPTAQGNYQRWVNDTQFSIDDVEASHTKAYVLNHIIQQLTAAEKLVLGTIAAFRMPIEHQVLAKLLIASDKSFENEQVLQQTLTSLQQRFIVGLASVQQQYDLHPVIRRAAWEGYTQHNKTIYTDMRDYFQAIPHIDKDAVKSFDDLSAIVELYYVLIQLGRYEDAGMLFYERLEEITLYHLAVSRQRITLLEALFPDGVEAAPAWNTPDGQGFTLNALGQSYQLNGQPEKAISFFERQVKLRLSQNATQAASIGLANLANVLWRTGKLKYAESVAQQTLAIHEQLGEQFRKISVLWQLGIVSALCGVESATLQQALQLSKAEGAIQSEGVSYAYCAYQSLLFNTPQQALIFSEKAWAIAGNWWRSNERDFILSAWLQGVSNVRLGEHSKAESWLTHALERARNIDMIEAELPILNGLIELWLGREEYNLIPPIAEQVMFLAQRGGYPLILADLYNLQTQHMIAVSEKKLAEHYATLAYQTAWCDAPPYTYNYAMNIAEKSFKILGMILPTQPNG